MGAMPPVRQPAVVRFRTPPRRAYAEAPGPVLRGVDVVEREHRAHLPVGAGAKAVFAVKFARVAERAEQHVPHREVGKVVVMKSESVVHAVRFRPLDEVAHLLRGAYVQCWKKLLNAMK